MVKGTYKYVPPEMLEELENMKKSSLFTKDADCFRKIAENARIGRQIRFTIEFNVKRKK